MKIRQHSMQGSLLAMIALAVVLVCAVVMGVFRMNMANMLSQTESMHVNELCASTSATLDQVARNLQSATVNMSSWDETRDFALGKNTESYIKNYMDGGIALKNSQYNYVIIKDLAGRDLYSSAYDLKENQITRMPLGLSTAITRQANASIIKYVSGTAEDRENFEHCGILVHEKHAYLLCTLPITDSLKKASPVGTFTYGLALTNEYFSDVIRLPNVSFDITHYGGQSLPAAPQILPINAETIEVVRYMEGIDKAPLQMTMKLARLMYTEGSRLTLSISILLITMLLSVMLLLFALAHMKLVQPILLLSRDVSQAGEGTLLPLDRYGNQRELHTLTGAINGMMSRMEASRVQAENSQMSITVLQNILNSMEAYIYVSDMDTDKILFINDKMREHFELPQNLDNIECWKVLQQGFTERCSFCPVYELTKHPEAQVVWEERNTVTGRYYKNTDRAIDWTYGKRVHMQYSLDITDIRNAEAALKKRLQQQQLAADISQLFMISGDIEQAINDTLRMIGQFMHISRTTVLSYESRALNFRYEWRSEPSVPSKVGTSMPIQAGEAWVADKLVNRELPYFNMDDFDRAELALRYDPSAITCLIFPVFVNEQLWGALKLDQMLGSEYQAWTPYDTSMGTIIAGILSGALSRQFMQGQLLRMSSMVKTSPQFISMLAPSGEFQYLNPASRDITGYSEEELIQGGLPLIHSPEDCKYIHEEILPLLEREGYCEFELVLNCKDKTQRIMRFYGFTVGSGASLSYGSIAADITKTRKLEQDLILAKEQAEHSSKAKGEFLSRMSHEMRTPMNAIIGMTTIALSSEDQERREDCLNKIDLASKHLLGVINDILDMSKIESGKFELSEDTFLFKNMLASVMNVAEFRAKEKRQHLSVRYDPGLDAALYGDAQHLAQVITNLITNAVKFTPDEGNISLRMRVTERENDQFTLLTEVTDDGIGISQEQQKRLFQSFEQADGSISRRFGGTGLGLAISKHIVELMGGAISLTSEEGKGSTFTFTARLKYAEEQMALQEPAERKAATRQLAGKRVLIAEDVMINREIVVALLGGSGLVFDEAENGRIAVDMFSKNPMRYDLILMDIQMPEVDGLEATRRIRALKLPRAKETPIIAMTANAFKEDVEKCIEAGMNAHISKPVDRDVLWEVVGKYLEA